MGLRLTVDFGGHNFRIQYSRHWQRVARAVRRRVFLYEPTKLPSLGSYSRREQEWTFQSNLAAGELNQIFKQLRGAQIREAIAQKEYKNHQTQMRQAQDIQKFSRGDAASLGDQGQYQKASTVGFYLWMKGAVQGALFQCLPVGFFGSQEGRAGLATGTG